jgi:XTP/dITP diphosphohydrolase
VSGRPSTRPAGKPSTQPAGKLRLVIASLNDAKCREVAEILAGEGLEAELLSLLSLPTIVLPAETGTTFAENALAKAKAAARIPAINLPTLADDSGLEVDALGGEPGIRSARYLGPLATDEDRYLRVLELMQGVPEERRTARFRCAAAFATPGGDALLAEGTCEGAIAIAPAGEGGFGYDPIFVPNGYSVTMAQASPAEKNAISHRGRAFRALARLIRESSCLVPE